MHAARQRYEQAAIEVTDVHKEAQVTTIAARVLAEEAHIAESHLTAAQRSTSTGLAALFLAERTASIPRTSGAEADQRLPVQETGHAGDSVAAQDEDHQVRTGG